MHREVFCLRKSQLKPIGLAIRILCESRNEMLFPCSSRHDRTAGDSREADWAINGFFLIHSLVLDEGLSKLKKSGLLLL